MNVATVSTDVQEHLRRIRVDEYHRMIEAGILGEDEGVQLVDGMLVAMTPQGRAHAYVIQELTRAFVGQVGDGFRVLSQLPLTLSDDSEPEPDLAIVEAREASSTERHPGSAVLVVEVAGDSLRLDRRTKAGMYARNGIPEYWIVNLAEAVVEIHADPDPSGLYRSVSARRRGETAAARSVAVSVDVDSLFP
jgi:Uma2 family endonuclease